MPHQPRVHLVTLGCARNDVDSDELAGRLVADGWAIAEEPGRADIVLVNTCGFIDAAKAESIATVLDLSDSATVVAAGCLAERYGSQLAEALPEAAVLGFDDYPQIGQRLRTVLAGGTIEAHQPRDRRTLLPVTPVLRQGSARTGRAGAPDRAAPWHRHRLAPGPVAALKIASGCDRRCGFCAIPTFRGAFISRPVAEILREAQALAGDGVVEAVLVSENSTAYGKDLPDSGGLAGLLRVLAAESGLRRIRVSYLQPAEVRPDLLDTMAALPAVAPYFEVSFQHASGPLLRRMRRFGDADSFLALIAGIRSRVPDAGIRSNVIVGFPGETGEDVEILSDFLEEARLDAVGVFGYSDQDGTEGAGLPGKIDPDEIALRASAMSELAEHIAAARASQRVGQTAELLVAPSGDDTLGQAGFQGPGDGGCIWSAPQHPVPPPGALVPVFVTGSDGVDLLVTPGDGRT